MLINLKGIKGQGDGSDGPAIKPGSGRFVVLGNLRKNIRKFEKFLRFSPRCFVYPWTKNTLPREIFKLVGPSVLAKGFKIAIFDDF